MALLSRDQILGASDRETQDVEVPEWGGTVRVATMSAGARDAFDASLTDSEGNQETTNFRAKLVAATVVDEDGERVFGSEDIDALAGHGARAIDRVFDVAARLNGFTKGADYQGN